ncbi:MAG: family 16 glycoside hydrolase [Aurantibacter sp.]
MKTIRLVFIILSCTGSVIAQQNEIVPDLSKVKDTTLWNLSDRELISNGPVHLSRGDGDGVLWLKTLNFKNGTIELDIKGRDIRGESFVGLAFHGLNRDNFDLIYFRPFNFESQEKQGNSIQYVSLPDFTWQRLREEHPGVYENAPTPVPDPDEWLHATIVIDHPTVKVFVNNANEPSLTVEQLSTRKEGWIGFWVGSNSEGEFKNLKVKEK